MKKTQSRRQFNKTIAAASVLAAMPPARASGNAIRLGAPVYGDYADPVDWAQAHRQRGYGGAYCPVDYHDSAELKRAYVQAARDADLVIAEVGAWSNPLSDDEAEQREALQKNIEGLALADEIGANCCVNIAGSRGASWAGPHKDNLSDETFDKIVEIVRKIIDAVGPTRTFYTLEAMPFTWPESPYSYVRLIKAIDRERFACHLDPTNFVNSPHTFYGNSALIQEAFKKLGPWIKSCHAKDLRLRDVSVVQFEEVIPGAGSFDYVTYLTELSKLPGSIPLMLEHLQTAEEYQNAADYIRAVGRAEGLRFI